MKKSYRNGVVLIIAVGFLSLGLISETTDAKTRAVVQPTVTPKDKKSPTPIAKATPKVASKALTKSSATPKPVKTPVKSNSTVNAKTSPAKNSKSNIKTTVDSKSVKSNSKLSTTSKPISKLSTAPKLSASPKLNPKPTVTPQVIVAATSVRVRQKPTTSSPQLTTINLGKILPTLEKNAAWYQIEYADGKTGWISKTLVKNYDPAKREQIYREIADRYVVNKKLDFATASEAADFLKTASMEVKTTDAQADLSLQWLRVLTVALHTIPFGKSDQEPYKTFLKANEKNVVYSEPSGEWYVRSDVFWELHGKFVELPVAEEIAWTAAQNPIPGECEGYVNCYLYQLRQTDGEYLNFYPSGKYSKLALQNITSLLDPIVSDLSDKKVYTAPADISDRAEFNRFLTELRTIISKVPDIEKNKPLQQINKLGEGYK